MPLNKKISRTGDRLLISKNLTQSGGLSLIWGNLRNHYDFSCITIPTRIALTGIASGEFPVDDYHPVFLEIPKNDNKLDLSGRFNNNCSSRLDNSIWYHKRIISLPIYETNGNIGDNDSFELLAQSWHHSLVPEEIPLLALSVKVKGSYCDEREGQYVLALLVFSDKTARLLELDWYEGPVEDCITPEWSIKSSYWLTLKDAVIKLRKICSKPTGLNNSIFSIFVNPLCLGEILTGDKNEARWAFWKCEWSYEKYSHFIENVNHILTNVENILN